jgi:O-antigen/teichoic acid export membrane protein
MEIKYVVWIAGINIFSNALLLNWFFMSIEKMEIIALRQLVTGILNLSGMMIFVHNQNDIVLAMIVTVSALLLNSLWMLVYYIKYYNKLKFHYDLVFWKELLKASLPIAMTFFITLIYNYVSIQILGFTRNFHEAGIYNSAFQALVVTLIPLSIIQNAFFPLLSRSETRENRESVFKKFSLLIYIIGSILTVGFFTFSPEIIHIIFGNKFSEAGPILRILMISGMVMYLNVSLSQPLVAWKKERQVFYAMLAGGIVSLILNAILIPILGPKGAAFASISTELVVFTGQSIIFYKLMKKFYVSKLFVCLGLAVVACIAGKYLSTIGIHAIISGIISFGIYVSFIFLFRITSIGEIKNYLIKK